QQSGVRSQESGDQARLAPGLNSGAIADRDPGLNAGAALNVQRSTLNTQHSSVPPVERFTRDYYRHASTVYQITHGIMRRAEGRRMFLGIGLDCKRRQIVPANQALEAEDPLWMLWACEL